MKIYGYSSIGQGTKSALIDVWKGLWIQNEPRYDFFCNTQHQMTAINNVNHYNITFSPLKWKFGLHQENMKIYGNSFTCNPPPTQSFFLMQSTHKAFLEMVFLLLISQQIITSSSKAAIWDIASPCLQNSILKSQLT